MTLSRQLILLIAVLLLLVLLGTFFISLRNTQSYLESQLASHSQDAATSLGLSLSPPMSEYDIVTMESMVDAMFDGGDYGRIAIRSVEGEMLIERSAPGSVEGIPPWFIDTLALETPESEALVMAGWRQAASVTVSSHPGYAYRQLWRTVSETFWWFLGCAILGCIVGVVALRVVLRPVKAVEWQADSICRREFAVLKPLPRTREPRRIVEAMNRLSQKVQSMLSEQEVLATKLRAEAHQDPVTGAGNKRYFEAHLADRIASTEAFARGALCLIQLRGFKTFNDTHGYTDADALLRWACERLGEAASETPKHLLARLSGADFALLAEDVSVEEAQALGARLSAALARLYDDGLADHDDVGHIGVAYYTGGKSASDLLSEADMALRAAQSEGANAWHLLESVELEPESIRGATDWRGLLDHTLAQRGFALHYQPVVACPDRTPLHHEVLVRMPEPHKGGALLNAGVFMPLAERLGLVTQIDRQVVAMVLARLAKETGIERSYAVNLSPHSVEAAGFVDWLHSEIAQRPDAAQRLVFELPEYGAVPRMGEVRALVDRLSPLGVRFSLDHFGRGFRSFAYLQSLRLDYLKVDGSFQRQLSDNRDHQFFLQSLADIAHGLDMKVIAEGVENDAVWSLLPELHLDGAQGYFLGEPTELIVV